MKSFALRNAKEILRDALNLAFGIAFPVVLLLVMSAIQSSLPVSVFAIESLSGGIASFGLTFFALFSATLVAKDRESALLKRLYTTPMRGRDFIFGYTLPLVPMAVVQCALCYAVCLCLGLKLKLTVICAVLASVPVVAFYIFFGLLCGSVLGSKQVGSICGALLTNLAAFMSGAWIDINLIGGAFLGVAKVLPFYRCTELLRCAYSGTLNEALVHLLWVLGYALICAVLSIKLFLRQTRNN